jgi:microcystin degradation protein MlrC
MPVERKMRIFTAAMVTETNSFSPIPTGWSTFEACGLRWDEHDYSEENFFTESVLHIRRLAEADGHEVVLGMSAYADPGGPVEAAVYETMRDEMLRQIGERGPFDAVLLTLHGAMVAEGHDDCEGELLARIRSLLGPGVFVGAMLDPHCHLSAAMVEAADIITIMKEYPHIDGKARLEDLYHRLIDVRSGEVRPVSVLVDCHMVGVWPTTQEPIRSLVDRITLRELDESILAIGFAHGFPWGDVADAGARILVTADACLKRAEAAAHAVAGEVWALREAARLPTVSVEEALDQVASSASGLTILADVADNPGGGAPGDSTFLLRAVLQRGLREIGLAILHDPESVQRCRRAGVGTRLRLDLGGKLGAASGEPVQADVLVRGYSDHHSQRSAGEAAIPLGPSAWVELDGIHIIISQSRFQAMSPEVFEGLGLDLARLQGVVVKSTHHFRACFQPVSDRILAVGAPGALSPNFDEIAYAKRAGPYWPRSVAEMPPTTIFRKAR